MTDSPKIRKMIVPYVTHYSSEVIAILPYAGSLKNGYFFKT